MKKFKIILLFLCFPFLLNCLNFTPREMIIKTSSPIEITNNKFALDEFDDFLSEKKIKNLKPILNKFQNQYFTASFEEELDWQAIENLRFSGIEYIQPNYLNEFSLTPNDPLYPDQEINFENINLPHAWNYTTGNSEIIVGVIDSGIHFGHPDLQTNIFINPFEIPDNGIDDDNNGYIDDWHGWDFTDAPELAYMASGDYLGQDNDPTDELHHGTHVSGIIAADTNNDLGISGICWNTKILPIRCGFQTIGGMGGYLQDDDAAAGIIYAADMGASVINCSWGSPNFSQIIADACFYAYDKGSIVVVSSGNTGESGIWYPAIFSTTISVGAVDENKNLASFSTYGSQLDLVAPGINVLSTYSEDEDNLYSAQSGTSMSAPFVSASIALLLSVEPSLNFEQVHSRLACSAIDLGESGFDNFYGNGLLDVYALLTEVSFPQIEISYPFENAGMKEDFDIIGTVQANDFFRYFVMYTSSETPSALDWFDVETHANTPKYYNAQVENDFLAHFNLPYMDDTYQIKVEVVTNDNKRYSYIQTVHIDQTPPELIKIANMKRYDSEFTSYYVQTVFDDITNLSLTCEPVSGQSYETFSNYADSIHVICLPDNIPENYYTIALEATNISNLRTSIANASPINIDYLYINTNIYEQAVLINELVPIRKPIDFDDDGLKNEFVAKEISENSETIKIFKFDNNQLFTEYVFQNDFYPLDAGIIHENSLLNVLGLANNKSVLYEITETGGNYSETFLWMQDQVYGGRLLDYNNDGLDEIALIENKTISTGTRRVISLYNNSFESLHTLLNETATFIKNEFIAVACGNLYNNFSLDIIATDKDGDVLIFEMEDIEYEMVWTHRLPVQNAYYLQIGDFDGDGNDDFCVGGYIHNETDPAKTFSYFEFFSNSGIDNQYESMGYVSFSNVELKNSITKADLDNNGDDEIIISVPPNLYIIDYQDGQFIPVWKGFSSGTEQNAIIAFSETDTEKAKIITNLESPEMKSSLISKIEDFFGPPTPEAFRAQPLNESAVFLSWISTDSIRVYRKFQEIVQIIGSISEENYIDDTINQISGFDIGDTLYYQVTALNENYNPFESLPTLWKPAIPMQIPQIQSILMTGINELKVFFDRQLSNDAISSSHFTVNNGIGKPSSVNFISEQKGLLLRFSNYLLNLINEYFLTITGLTGETGVPFPDGDYPFVFNEDTTAPEILFVETMDKDIVKLSFTEPITSSTAENLENYTLVLPVIDQYNGIDDIEYFEDFDNPDSISFYITIQMVKNLEYSNQSYFLKLDNIEDISGNKISNNGNKCQFSLTDISDLKHLIVYPNPFNTNEFDGVRFVNMPLEKAGKIWIYDLSGNLVFNKKIKALTELNNFYIWDGDNNANKKVSSGLYLYIIKMGNSYKKGKIAVIN